MQEELLLKNRFQDLASKAYEHNQYTFTNFLNAMEVSTLLACVKEFSYVPFALSGGYEGSERQVARFGSEQMLGYEMEFPICCILVEPLIKKFADEFSHRDFLGALMNLGIERNTIGDIVLQKQAAYLFCLEKIAPFILENLDKVKHTSVKCKIVESIPEEVFRVYEKLETVVSSERIDAVLSKVLHMSRSQSVLLFQEKKIFVNAKLCENTTYQLKKGDIVAVRGFGKMIYEGIAYETKKEKLCVRLKKYA